MNGFYCVVMTVRQAAVNSPVSVTQKNRTHTDSYSLHMFHKMKHDLRNKYFEIVLVCCCRILSLCLQNFNVFKPLAELKTKLS